MILLFIVAALGYFIGSIKIKGNSIGVAAVLFVGLAIGAMDSTFNVPQIIFELGLVLFVYSIGISSGPAFFKSFKKNGFKDIIFVVFMLTLSAIVALLLYLLFNLDGATISGLYAGSTTNTPALAGVIDMVNQVEEPGDQAIIQKLVIGYTYSYPMGVLGVMIAIIIMEKLLKIDYKEEIERIKHKYNVGEGLTSETVEITNPEISQYQLRDIRNHFKWNIVFGRLKNRAGEFVLTNWDTVLNIGDRLLLVGSKEELDKAINILGKITNEKISYDRKEYDTRRIFVSNHHVVGKSISELNLAEKFDATITRIRRGDVDMLATSDVILERGDRIRFVARRKDLKSLSTFFGDSYYESSKVNIFSFGLVIALGLLLGTIPINLPGGINFKLGFAGGPLIVSLIFGAIQRTGNMVWTLPYAANVTLRQIGLTLLLAVIGLRSGNSFVESLSSGGGLILFISGGIISMLGACISLFLGYRFFKLPFSLLLGFISNQPAILDFANNRCENRIPFIGYTIMFPIALVLKIIFAQMLFLLLQ